MAWHQCIDCKADDPGNERPVRQLASQTPKRCHTHLKAFETKQRKQARGRQVERTYGISPEDNHELFLFQGGRCWLCRKATGATKSLAVDHDHATDEVRGRLCGPCNQFIGKLGDDPEAARRLVQYLTGDTPYRRLKAKQTIEADGHVVDELDRVIQDYSGELRAVWRGEDHVWRDWLVRRIDGTWSVARTDD